MSVELRIYTEGECECGQPHRTGYEPGCDHGITCDWGEFGDPPLVVRDYTTHRTTVENPQSLILVGKRFADRGAMPPNCRDMDVSTFYNEGDRRFMRFDADNGSWTWELFTAHWWDGEECALYVGRWPD